MTEKQQQTPPDQTALKDIEKRLNALKRDTFDSLAQSSHGEHPIGRMMWLAFNVISDLIAGVICGLGIGYGLDRWLGTRPVFIAVFLAVREKMLYYIGKGRKQKIPANHKAI